MALEQVDAPASLVAWAAKHPKVSGVHLPWDRPWFWCPDEIRRTPEGYWVLCGGRSLVQLRRIITCAPHQVLYIGQCSCHERIVYSYRPD